MTSRYTSEIIYHSLDNSMNERVYHDQALCDRTEELPVCQYRSRRTGQRCNVSSIESAKENGIKPYDYIVWLLKAAPELKLGEHPERAEQLLPTCFQQAIVYWTFDAYLSETIWW